MGFGHLFMGKPFSHSLSQKLEVVIKVSENGLTGSIMTFYELTEGDMAHTTGGRLAACQLHSLTCFQSFTSFHRHCSGERSTYWSRGERHKSSRVKM